MLRCTCLSFGELSRCRLPLRLCPGLFAPSHSVQTTHSLGHCCLRKYCEFVSFRRAESAVAYMLEILFMMRWAKTNVLQIAISNGMRNVFRFYLLIRAEIERARDSLIALPNQWIIQWKTNRCSVSNASSAAESSGGGGRRETNWCESHEQRQ